MATYRSPEEFAVRFSGAPARIDGKFQFPVEAYLLARGDAYAATYVPEAFVCLSESIDLHTVDAARIRVPVTLVGILEDQLIPISDLRSLQARLAGPASLVELSSLYGHDAFLKEAAALESVFARALAGQAGFGASAVSPGGELWGDARPIDWTAWDPARRRVDPGGPADELVEHLSGAQNVEFRRT